MTSHTYSTSINLTTFSCGTCGGVYAINELVRSQHKREGTGWHCPYCREGWGYFGDGEIDKLKESLRLSNKRADFQSRRADRQSQAARTAEYRRRAAVGRLTKIRNKIARGECPCCGKRFQNLLEHLQKRHADWVEEHGGLKLLEHLPKAG